MKMKLLVIVLAFLIAPNLFAASYTWTSTTGGSFTDTSNWSGNPWSTSNYNDEYRIYYNAMPAAAVVDSEPIIIVGRLRISGGGPTDPTPAKLDIVDGSDFYVAEFRIGDGVSGASGGQGLVTQTGGSVTMIASVSGTSYSRDLIIGRGASSGPATNGQYIISGGSLSYVNTGYDHSISDFENDIEYNTARLQIGVSRTGTGTRTVDVEGTFTVIGDAATISMKELQVGGDGTARDDATETGTLEFQLVDGAVSVIEVGSTMLDSLGAQSFANLIVELTSGVQAEATLLVKNTGATDVAGAFDNITLLGGLVGDVIYTYNSDTGELTGGNDIALLIPEPVTLMLFALGGLALREKR